VVLDAADASAALEGLALVGGGAAPVLVRVGPEDAARAGELLAAGAADVALRGDGPADAGFLGRLAELASRGSPRALPLRARSPRPDLVGESPQMQAVFALIEVASRTRATVLVSGETGTGKEIVARAIHDGSARRGAPFVAVNCAAFPDTLLESELFGHVRGAFTGAEKDRPGLFEQADGGTLFLDEVGETSAPCQAKLLRALQEREVRRVGGSKAHRIDVRVIAATNRDLRREAETSAFRADLYYRLAVFPIELPPLRARPRDVPALAERFLQLHGRRDGKPGVGLSPDALALLQARPRPRSCSRSTPGPATCASSRTRSSARSRWPRPAKRCSPRTSPSAWPAGSSPSPRASAPARACARPWAASRPGSSAARSPPTAAAAPRRPAASASPARASTRR
jgi:DNA-binding NtrC family response regulator